MSFCLFKRCDVLDDSFVQNTMMPRPR